MIWDKNKVLQHLLDVIGVAWRFVPMVGWTGGYLTWMGIYGVLERRWVVTQWWELFSQWYWLGVDQCPCNHVDGQSVQANRIPDMVPGLEATSR